jgi:hypothetical protein
VKNILFTNKSESLDMLKNSVAASFLVLCFCGCITKATVPSFGPCSLSVPDVKNDAPFQAAPMLNDRSYAMKWNILGPFAYNVEQFKTPQAALQNSFYPNELVLAGTQDALAGTRWNLYNPPYEKVKDCGDIKMTEIYEGRDLKNFVIYAIGFFKASKAVEDVILYTGGNNSMKIWINGELLENPKALTDGKADKFSFSGIKLNKGFNHVIVKCVFADISNAGFSFRFAMKNNEQISVFR